MKYIKKRHNEPGSAPGELASAHAVATTARADVIVYTADTYQIEAGIDLADSWVNPQREGEKLWLAVHGRPAPALLEVLEKQLQLHPLALEDAIHAGQRSKVDDYESHLFVVLQRPHWEGTVLAIGQVSFFLGRNFVVSVDDVGGDAFDLVRKRLEISCGGRIRTLGVDYLFYALVDLVIDRAFPVLEGYAEELEEMELKVMSSPKQPDLLDRLHESRRELVFLRRALWGQRDAASALLREELTLISKSTRVYLRDCADHAHHVLDLVDAYRDMSVAVMELLLSSQNKQLNEAMRVLTMIATIFIPLSFVTGIYGMNFDTEVSPWNMPELHWKLGYPGVLLLLLVLGLGMVVYFKRKGWL